MSCLKHGINTSLAVVILFGSVPALAQQAPPLQGYLYVSDNGYQSLDRYAYSWDGTNPMSIVAAGTDTGNPSSSLFINLGSNNTAGIVGTRNDLILVTQDGIKRYDFSGNVIGTTQAILNQAGGAYPLIDPGHAAASADGKYLFVAETGAGMLDKIDLNSGKIVAQAALANAHDVSVLPDGSVIASGLSGSTGIVRFTSDLSTSKQLVSPNPDPNDPSSTYLTSDGTNVHLAAPTGLAYAGGASGGKLYVQQNNGANAGAVLVFDVTLGDGSINAASASFQSSASLSTGSGSNAVIANSLDAEIGVDGKYYAAAFGSGYPFASTPAVTPDPNYFNNTTTGIFQYDITTGVPASTLSVAGFNQTTFTGGDSGLYAPKYMAFENNFIAFNDAGTPEPGTEALMVSAFGAGAIFLRRRRKRVANLEASAQQ